MSLSSTAVRRIYREVLSIRKSPPAGISLLETEESEIDIVNVILEGPEETPFQDGLFHLQFQFTSEYPATPPNANFMTKIFHPNIAPRTGEVCVNTLKRDWSSKVTITEILMTIKSLLIDPNPTSALNEEAGKLLLEDYPAYCAHAKLYTEIHAMKPKQKTKPSSQKQPSEPDKDYTTEKKRKSNPPSTVTPLAASHAQNAPTPEPDIKPRIFSLGIGIKKAGEDGENRPVKRSVKRRAGKGDLRRL